MQSPRVLLVSANFYPKIGGPSTSVPEIARILVKRGFVVDVITSIFPGYPEKQEQDGYTIYRAKSQYTDPTERNRMKDLNAVWEMAKLIKKRCREEKYLLIHSHDANLSLLATKLANPKLPILAKFTGDLAIEQRFASITSLEQLERDYFSPGFSPSFEMLRMFQGLLTSWPDLIIANSKDTWKSLEAYKIPESKRTYLYNGFTHHPQTIENSKSVSKSSPKKILYFGRLVPWKGIHILLQAFEILSKEKNVELHIVGGGPAESDLRKLAETLTSKNRITFLATVPAKVIPKHILESDVVVLPSFYDTFPHGMLETLAYARPLVATRVNGIPEVVVDGETGWLVEPNNPTAMARAIQEVLENPSKAERIAKAGQNFVLSRFTWERIVDELIQIYAKFDASLSSKIQEKN